MKKLLFQLALLLLLAAPSFGRTLQAISLTGMTVNTAANEVILTSGLDTASDVPVCYYDLTPLTDDCSVLATRAWVSLVPSVATVNSSTGLITAAAFGLTVVNLTDSATTATMTNVAISSGTATLTFTSHPFQAVTHAAVYITGSSVTFSLQGNSAQPLNGFVCSITAVTTTTVTCIASNSSATSTRWKVSRCSTRRSGKRCAATAIKPSRTGLTLRWRIRRP